MLPFHNVIFFYNHCPIQSTTMFTACPQHIHTVLFTITLPSILCMLLHMLPFHNVILFHNHCPIHSTPMFTAYPQHIHTVLFTITLPSILTGLFTFASFSQCEYFSTVTVKLSIPLCLQWCFIGYIQYCLKLLSPVYCLCCLHMLSFSQCEYLFHNHYPIHSTTMFTAYP